ncbi:hypothetical protein LINPERPRIM_LOCUS27260, partial [Linum perenne]
VILPSPLFSNPFIAILPSPPSLARNTELHICATLLTEELKNEEERNAGAGIRNMEVADVEEETEE